MELKTLLFSLLFYLKKNFLSIVKKNLIHSSTSHIISLKFKPDSVTNFFFLQKMDFLFRNRFRRPAEFLTYNMTIY